jgi:hypothetical protein
MSMLMCTAGCSTPVGIKRVGTKEAHRLLTASALSTGTPSEHSLQVLSRLDLLEQFDDDPEAALAALHTILQSTTDSYRLTNRLFALAELSFLNAERRKQHPAQNLHCQAVKGQPCPPAHNPQEEKKDRAYYLAAAVYAYAFLFPDDQTETPHNPADPRLRLAYDLYNRGLAEGLTAPGKDEVILASGQHRLPFGVLDIEFVSTEFSWAGHKL